MAIGFFQVRNLNFPNKGVKKMAKDIVDVAIGELGYRETGKNSTKYGKWYGMNGAAWCHMFVSWCADQAGVSTSVVPKTASTTTGMNWFKRKGLFKYKGKYTPKRGDIVYFKTNRSHVGIVEKVSGSTLHTIEGNTSDKVARKTYPLSNSTITGYGVPKYKNYNFSSGKSEKSTGSKNNLSYLENILKNKKASSGKTIKADIESKYRLPEGNVLVMVKNGSKYFQVPVEDGMKIVWERKGTPGVLTFTSKYEKSYKIVEGNEVSVIVDGTKMFFGFVFTRKMTKTGRMEFTVYDQLRYLKNKDTIIFRKKRADEMIKIIAGRFHMNCGTLANTGHKMSVIENNTTLFDMIQNALDNTLMSNGKIYVLYDKAGKLTLSDLSKMKVNNCLVDAGTGEDFSYQTSIDHEVYNQIKLIYENKDKNKKKDSGDLYVTRHKKNINKWGVLQYVEKIDSPDKGKEKAKVLLKLYNKKRRCLTITGVIGNTKVRAGSLVPVILNLKDIKVANYMIVEKVTHEFSNCYHKMELVVSGGDFNG